MADWQAIKTEYITDSSASYRKLADKYGVHYNAVANRSKQEGWQELRKQHYDSTVTTATSVIAQQQVSRTTKLLETADRLGDKVRQRIDALDAIGAPSQEFRHLSATLKDLKEICMIKSDAERREQEARIRHLEKAAAEADSAPSVTVLLEGGADEYVS